MRPIRPAFAVGAVAALFVGGVALATSRNSSPSSSVSVQPFTQQAVVQPSPVPLTGNAIEGSTTTITPLGERVVYRERVVTQTAPRVVHRTSTRVVTTKRSGKKSALIIGGSAAGGAITGGLIGGKKGAIIGGLIGGAGGTVYDRKTRKKTHVVTQ